MCLSDTPIFLGVKIENKKLVKPFSVNMKVFIGTLLMKMAKENELVSIGLYKKICKVSKRLN